MKYVYPLSLSILLLAGLAWWNLSPTESTNPVEELHSGAFESLSFLGAARSFPKPDLPDEGYYRAWQQMQRNTSPLRSAQQTGPWESLGPHNRAGRMISLAINPQNSQTLFAGSASGGLWRSYSRGSGIDAWERIETGFPALGISQVTFAPGDSTVLYIGTGEVYNAFAAGTGAAFRNTRGSYGVGILKSTDGGQTWAFSLDWTARQTEGIWDIKVHPTNANLVWAATTDGIYRSTDAGANWEQIHDVLLGTSLLLHPDDPDRLVVAHGNFASPGFGIYTTADGGDTWTKKGDPLPQMHRGKIQLAQSLSDPEIIYASVGNGFGFSDGASWLCRSNDFGDTWAIQNTTDYSRWQGWYSHDVAVHPTNPDEIMAIGIDVWKSTNAGVSLLQKTNGGIGDANPPIGSTGTDPFFVHSDCHVVLYDPTDPNILYIADDGGIHRSEDAGETFQAANGRLQTVQFYNGFSNSAQDPSIAIGGLQDNGTNLQLDDKRWTYILGGDGSWSAINPEDDNMVFASSQFLNIARSFDGGVFFGNVRPPTINNEITSFIAPFVISPLDNDNVLIYAGRSRVYRSRDSGDSWEVTNAEQPLDGNPVLAMSLSPIDNLTLYVATAPQTNNRSNVFATNDGGVTWANITRDLPNAYPMDLATDPSDVERAYITYSGFGNPHVLRTDDFGDTWTDVSTGLPDVPTNAVIVDPLFPNNVYVGNDLGVFVSTDFGDTWSTYMEGLPAAIMVFDLTISPANRKLRIASHGNGVYERDLVEEPITSTEEPEIAALDLQVWPNPTSEMLQLALPAAVDTEDLRVEIIDGLGRIHYQNTGERNLQVAVSDWTAGTYYCRVQVGEQVLLRPVVIQ
ncbi:MAG: T9SS type A sorting domain-containing protein [Bacteroidota bacterium]